MKRYTPSLFIVIMLLFFIPLHAQNELQIDFQNINSATIKSTFNYNQKVRVKIINVNRFIYKLTAEMTEEEFNNTVPTILKSINLPSFFTSQTPVINSAFTGKIVDPGQSLSDLQTDFKDKLKDLIRGWRIINDAIDKHNEIVHISKDCSKSFLTIETDVKNVFATFVGGTVAQSVADLSDKMQSKLADEIQRSNDIVNDMEELLTAWKTKRLDQYRSLQVTNDDILAVMNNDLKILQGKKPMDQSLVNAKEKEIRDQTRKIKEAEEDYTTEVKDNEAIFEKSKTVLADINKYKEDGKYFQLVDDIRKVNMSNYTYYSEIVTMEKDEYKFKINATSSDQRLVCNYPAEQKLEVVLRTKGGVKLDFSTGVFVMLGSDEFLGRTYYYKPLNATQSSISAADNGKRALLGIGALMHVYKRSPSKFKIGGAIGISSSFNFDAVNFHLGPSFITGDKDRFCITVGITAREVALLDKKYTLDQPYNKDDLPENIPTYKMFPKFGGFFSFTYNISKFNK